MGGTKKLLVRGASGVINPLKETQNVVKYSYIFREGCVRHSR